MAGVRPNALTTTATSVNSDDYLVIDGTTAGTRKILKANLVKTISPAADSTTAVQINKADGVTNVLNVDTTNSRVGIGRTPTTYQFEVNGYMGASRYYGLGTLEALMSMDMSTTTQCIFNYNGVNILTMSAPSYNVVVSSGNLGVRTASPTKPLSFGGGSACTIWMERHTTADTAGNALTIQAGGATSAATDKAGGDLTLKPGVSTGSGESGVTIQGCVAGSTGTDDGSFSTIVQVLGNKLGFYGATPIAKAVLATGASHTVDDVITALQNLGLVAQS